MLIEFQLSTLVFHFEFEKTVKKKKSLPVLGLEPGPIRWQAVTLTIALTGVVEHQIFQVFI